MALFMVVSLMVADTAMKHPTEAAAFRSWMQSTRYGWLIWRLALYALVAWGLLKIRHAPGLQESYRRPLLRISVVSVLLSRYVSTRCLPVREPEDDDKQLS